METEPRFAQGDEVTLRSEPDTAGAILRLEQRGDGQFYYQVFLESSRKPWIVESDLQARRVGGDPLSRAEQDVWGSPDAFLSFLTMKKLLNPLTDLLYSYQASRTDFYPHQYVPLLKLLDSPNQRILIADEVGLGKTIEAGLILAEQKSRVPMKRVLIVCQGALLIHKWVQEMRHRFDEPFEVLDSQRLESFLKEYEEGRDPELRAVASLPLLRQERWCDRLRDLRVALDMTVIDEAHRLKNRHSVSYALGEVLAEQSEVLVLLTATPLHLRNDDLFSLLHLLDPQRFPSMEHLQGLLQPQEVLNRCIRLVRSRETAVAEVRLEFARLASGAGHSWLTQDPAFQQVRSRLQQPELSRAERIDLEGLLLSLSPLAHVFTRSRRVDLDVKFAERTPVRVVVRLGEVEQEFLGQVEELARAVFQAAGSPFGAGLASITLRRQAASSLPATLQYLRDVLAAADSLGDLEEDLADLDLPEVMSTSFQLDERFHDSVLQLLNLYPGLRQIDSKWQAFLEQLRQQRQEGQVRFVVFSFFKRTLQYLQDRLGAEGFSTHLLTGAVPPEQRQEVVDRFRGDPIPCVLLSSEVGGEGLDFQFASVMFNYDMPWNPMVVEQRIGRIDRIGQASPRVVIFNFSVEGTIEERIFERLYDRIELFRRSVGDLEAILGEELSQLTQDILKYKLTPAEEQRRAEALADALIRQERRLQKLEQENASVAGYDSYFLQRVSEVRSGRRFLQPAELERFLSRLLEAVHPRARLMPVQRRKGVWRIQDAAALSAALGSHLGRQRSQQLLLQKLSGLIHHPEVTFEAAVAQSDRSLSLITSRHPLVELLKKHPLLEEDDPERFSPTGAFLCPGLPQQDFLVFFFLLAYSGYRRSLLLSALPVEVPRLVVRPELEAPLLAALSEGGLGPWQPEQRVGSSLGLAREAATSEVILQKSLREKELEVEAARLVSMRRNSLSITLEKRRRQYRERLEHASDERIRRMLSAAVDNEEQHYQRELAALEERNRVYCQEELIGVAYCRGLGDA